MPNVGDTLRKVRTREGLTQTQLSLQTGISQSYISQIEKGKRRLKWEEAELLAQGLGVSVSAFVTANPPHPREKEEVSS